MRLRVVKLFQAGLLLAGLTSWTGSGVAQTAGGGSGKDFKLPEYDPQGRLKSQVTGKGVKQLPNSQMLITTLHLETYRDDGKVELIVEAPECLYDSKRRIATSPGEMRARQADGKFTITGQGFEWQQTNSVLIISNRAHTIINKELLKPQAIPAPSIPAEPRQDLEVFADRFEFNSRTGLAVYRDHVRANDPQMKLASEELTVKTAPTGRGVESIVARRDVVIEQADTRATGDQAVYTTTATEDTIEVTGHAAWRSQGHEGKGNILILDRKRNKFKSTGGAYVKLSPTARTAGAQGVASAPTSTSPGGTNQPIEIFAELLTVDLPDAGGPVRRIEADQDVVIQQGDSRATGSRAVYTATAATELVEITGHPTFHTPRFEGKGELLKWNRLSGGFNVQRDGYLKIARDGLSPSATNRVVEVFADDYDFKPGAADFRGHVRLHDPAWNLAGETVSLKLSTPGNQIQSIVARRNVVVEQIENQVALNQQTPWRLTAEEVTASLAPTGNQIENIIARQNVMVEQIEGRTAENRNPTWRVTSEVVTVKLSAPDNRIDHIEARQNVVVKQSEARGVGDKSTPWQLTCEAVNLHLSARGKEIETIVAEKSVVVDQLESRAGGAKAAPWKLQCDQATVRLSSQDRQITAIVAERNVIIRQGDTRATGAKAVFTGTNSIVEMTGHPLLQMAPATARAQSTLPRRLEVTGAEVLRWDRANNKFRAKGDYKVAEQKGDLSPPK